MVLIDGCVNSLRIFHEDDAVGDQDEEEGDEGQEAQGIEEEKLWLGGDRKHVQQVVRVKKVSEIGLALFKEESCR